MYVLFAVITRKSSRNKYKLILTVTYNAYTYSAMSLSIRRKHIFKQFVRGPQFAHSTRARTILNAALALHQ